MNVFEDLIDELKEENLLEETVIESRQNDKDEFLNDVTTNFEQGEAIERQPSDLKMESQMPVVLPDRSENIFGDLSSQTPEKIGFENLADDVLIVGNSEATEGLPGAVNFPAAEEIEKKDTGDEKEFYRKRAIEEVSALQMVEHVLSGIEREQMKSAPKNYNDITAKKALHDFLQIAADVKSPEHAQAEFQLMQETETWCSALSHRDKRISVAHLRRFCETTKPALSSQALISLARFYRNLPYSEPVRSKFDFVVTKLFSKDDGGEKRVLVFSREELIQHLKELYAEWSSISLYSVDDDDSSIVLAALKFEDFMDECENAENFDELVKTDFFNRLRLFKESTDEVFFAPLVTAAAIECNARIGNRYIDLIRAEREKSGGDELQDKYGFMYDQAISDSTSKTFQLTELLREKTAKEKLVKTEENIERARFEIEKTARPESSPTDVSIAAVKTLKTESDRHTEKNRKTKPSSRFVVNKWLLAATILVIFVNAGLYLYVYSGTASAVVSTDVKKVNLANTSLQEFLKSARISGETFYGVTLPAWDSSTTERKEAVLKKIFAFGADKNFSKVHLLDKDGKTVGFASAEKVEVIKP